MKLTYAGRLIAASSGSRLLGITCTAAALVLAGCSAYEAGTPKAGVNYQGNPGTERQVPASSIEDVITANRDWYQMNH